MAGKTDNQGQGQGQGAPAVDPNDLDLVDDTLEDEGKDDAALWAEFESEDAGTAAPDADPDATPPADAGGESGQGDDWGAGAADTDPPPAPDSAAADGGDGAAAPPSGQPDGAQPSGEADQDPIWANATPEQRAAYEAAQANLRKLEQAERSNRGRLSALQRQLNEFRSQQQPGQQPQAAAQQPAASSEAASDGQGQQQPAGAGGDQNQGQGFLTSQEWQGFKDEYPEVAGPLEKVVNDLTAHITRQEKELSAIGQERRQSALEEQATLLAEEHPDWEDVTGDRGFVDWVNAQPRHIQEAAYRNANEIVDASEAADVVGRFKQYRGQQQDAQAGNNAPAGRQQPNGQGNGNSAPSAKRQHQLESASTARSRGPGAATGISEDGDPEQIWKQFDEMERRQARG